MCLKGDHPIILRIISSRKLNTSRNGENPRNCNTSRDFKKTWISKTSVYRGAPEDSNSENL